MPMCAANTRARTKGLIPWLDSAHAVHEAIRRAPAEPGKLFVVNLSGRGDKDTDIYRENFPELDAADPNPKAV
jgi:tryptophan synthase beta chain